MQAADTLPKLFANPNSPNFGFLQHTAFCVSAKDVPLGILELDFIGYEDDIKSFPYRQDFPKPVSSRWRLFLAEAITKLKGTGKDVIMLCDKEADFFELLNDLHSRTRGSE